MSRFRKRYERGQTLLLLLMVIAMSATGYVISRLNNDSAAAPAIRKARNAEVLNRAKQALIGYVAQRAATAGENNPGRLPCPEAASIIGTIDEGSSAPWVPAPATTTCSSIGRLPWRTIGLEKLVDSANEPLWYVVGPTWRLATSTSTLLINSNTVGDITVDGQQVVALIIAPGQAMNVQTATGCTARNQARSTPSSTMNPLDYIECFNSGTLQFITTAPSTSFNDQVVRITVADIMPAIEASIAQRIEREIVPVLKTAYVGTKWNTLVGDTVFPFAASFFPAGNYQGAALTRGLLPFSYSPPCSPVGDLRCTISTFHAWGTPTLSKVSGSGSLYGSPSCSVSGSSITCTGNYQSGSLQASFDDPVSNVANALRDFNPANHTVTVWTSLYKAGYDLDGWDNYQIETSTLSRRFNSNGSLSFVVGTPFRWASGKEWGYYIIEAQRPAISDHAILSASTGSSTGWFARNEWYRLLYYAIAPNYAPGGSLSCTTLGTCLSVANGDPTHLITPVGGQRAILILAGRSINGSARPSSTRSDYFELGNATAAYERRPVRASNAIAPAQRFNDRIVVIDSN